MKPVSLAFLAAMLPLVSIAQVVSLDVQCLSQAQQDEFRDKARAIRTVNAERRYVPGPFIDPVVLRQQATSSREQADEKLVDCQAAAKGRGRDPALACQQEAVMAKAAADRLAKIDARAAELLRLEQEELTQLQAARGAYPACEAPKVVQDEARPKQ